ncbi:MAG: hypothetical protein EOS71_00540 [Mesorhizobium sp.]|nr:hypothetical protein EOA35_00660 [Mesorhizobium sp. M8A.F.Ca.ET.023.01.1.1]RWC77766.1 MAG: hypothetical protein EOS71_00540 [Mesorhizobium sp.]TIS98759.1 MAG: hypothetical protein E5W88_05020 [Mesorhizobium sp.]
MLLILLDPVMLAPLAFWLYMVRSLAWQVAGAIVIGAAYAALSIKIFHSHAPTELVVVASVASTLIVTAVVRIAIVCSPLIIEWFSVTPLRRSLGLAILIAVGLASVIAPGAIMTTQVQNEIAAK